MINADGTRLIYGCEIEDEPVHCNWSTEELELYFDHDKEKQLKPESFVSIITHCRIEHPNYVPVVVRDSTMTNNNECGLFVGADTEFCIKFKDRNSSTASLRLDDRTCVNVTINFDLKEFSRHAVLKIHCKLLPSVRNRSRYIESTRLL